MCLFGCAHCSARLPRSAVLDGIIFLGKGPFFNDFYSLRYTAVRFLGRLLNVILFSNLKLCF